MGSLPCPLTALLTADRSHPTSSQRTPLPPGQLKILELSPAAHPAANLAPPNAAGDLHPGLGPEEGPAADLAGTQSEAIGS